MCSPYRNVLAMILVEVIKLIVGKDVLLLPPFIVCRFEFNNAIGTHLIVVPSVCVCVCVCVRVCVCLCVCV
jgi:hypothetical protein